MKTTWLLVMILLAVSTQSTSYARPANQGSDQTSSSSREPTLSDRAHAGKKDNQVRGEKDRMGGEYSDEGQNRPAGLARALPKPRPGEGHPKQPRSHQLRPGKGQATNNLGHNPPPGTAMDPGRAGSSKSTGTPDRMLKPASGPVRPPSGAVVNGQQFTNARNRGTSLAISGGPAIAARNPAAINGTEVKRKP